MHPMIEDSYRLSPLQRGMLFHSLAAKHAGVDLEQIVIGLREAIDAACLRQAWERVLLRHAVLRTAFRWEGLQEPLQEVHREAPLPFRAVDWRTLSPAQQHDRFEAFLETDRREGFDLGTPPLLRVTLVRMGEADFRCVWSFQHILLDGRSFPIVLKDLFAFYDALGRGEDLDLSAPRPYRDFIAWLEGRDRSGEEAFWGSVLKGFTATTPLPASPSRGGGASGDAGRGEQLLRLSQTLTGELRALADRYGLSLNTLVQGAWAVLLSRYGAEEDVVFGATRAGRRGTLPGAEDMVGLFINTLPVRAQVAPDAALVPWLRDLRRQQEAARAHEHAALVDIHRWSDLPAGQPLFESILVWDRALLDTALRAQGVGGAGRDFGLRERTNYPITLYGYGERELLLRLAYDRDALDNAAAGRILGQLSTLLEGMARDPERKLAELPLLTNDERRRQLVQWNLTAKSVASACVHHSIEEQAARTPDRVALVFEDRALTYRQLNARANRVARRLRRLGAGPEFLVGLFAERSLEMVVGVLGILKSGGAYVPLDTSYPKERLAFLLEDTGAGAVLSEPHLAASLPPYDGPLALLDSDSGAFSPKEEENVESGVAPENLAYVLYTSGSTGRPKGVMIEHRNVANFFAAMDERIDHEPPGVWLAVTSLSFDISVLELLWTLARGFKVVLHAEPLREAASSPRSQPAAKGLEFSLFYFASDEGEGGSDKYRLLLEGAKFADRNGFQAVWTPERHFHAFGGLYPNPSVTSAAIAAVTDRVQIRAGSVVLPLHDPIRVAEEWALVDNLSKGRVGISFASGWHPEDFVLAPEKYADRKAVMMRGIETVRRLWRGEAMALRAPDGSSVEVRTLPRPVQAELPVWVTTAGSVETYEMAGAIGANVLTHLLGQTLEDLTAKIAAYRRAWHEHGHAPGEGHVTLMVHTFVGDDDDSVREIVRKPMTDYLRSSVSLIKNFAGAWTAYRTTSRRRAAAKGDEFHRLSKEDLEDLLAFAFDRYFETSGLFGSPATCLAMIEKLRATGVDEIACLIDFGVEANLTLAHLERLDQVRLHAGRRRGAEERDFSLPAQIARHRVTHLQCTPSMARMLTAEPDARRALESVQMMLVGGEAFPASLAAELRALVGGRVINMYGPTETTIWSSTHPLDGEAGDPVPIGRPVANTQFYVLDGRLEPVPVGATGELFIGGAGVARGYFNRPDLTAERFVSDPFAGDPRARLYRTGDLARYREDGVAEFLGRVDHQVKIRGHRVEPGEVEAALAEHPAVREAVVTPREDAPGEIRLVAYIVPRRPGPPGAADLRAFLAGKLPDFLLPAAYVMLEALPLMSSGKLDRRALPAPQERIEGKAPFVAPRTAVEEALAGIWADSLGVERVGIHDNFFELGGNSLSTIQIAFRIRQVLQAELPLRAILTAPTVAGLAARLEERLVEQAEDSTLARLFGEIESLSDQEAGALAARELGARRPTA